MSETVAMLAGLAAKQVSKAEQAKSENRAYAEQHMPGFCELFDALKAAGMEPRVVKFERFHVDHQEAA